MLTNKYQLIDYQYRIFNWVKGYRCWKYYVYLIKKVTKFVYYSTKILKIIMLFIVLVDQYLKFAYSICKKLQIKHENL